MKEYLKPKFELIYLGVVDVITMSDFYIDDPEWFN